MDAVLRDSSSDVCMRDAAGLCRHKNCPFIIEAEGVCAQCKNAKRTLFQKYLRNKRRTSMKRLAGQRYRAAQNYKKTLVRAKSKIARLKAEVLKVMDRMEKGSFMETLEAQFQNSGNFLITLKEIANAAKVGSKKGRRYSEDWLLLCMLFHIRSPKGYRFAKESSLIPLPCVRTVRRYLSLIDTSCGFDIKFFELLKRNLSGKEEKARHGILLWDEMSVRESVSVCSSNLSYVGLIDFGEDGPNATSVGETADHALVFMFQPLADSYTQPVAVFASKGSVKGDLIAKLVIKCIILLERAGAKIHGFASDSAATNRKMWATLGIHGQLDDVCCSFHHPLDVKRKVFAFADTPHLIKNIRNRMLSCRELRVHSSQLPAKWDHFIIMHNADKQLPAELRVCPKITDSHLQPSNILKMRVRLASQVFSESMAKGLQFYHHHKLLGLEDINGTVDFCLQMNRMSDALNRSRLSTEVHDDSDDYMVLKESLEWLDTWEREKNSGNISGYQFLTNSTAEGLRITLFSMLEMIPYLKSFGFNGILTARVNQDSLERFFGAVRLAAGANDHPAAVTFLQLYKLLAVSGVLTPPKYGNCRVNADTPLEPIIKIRDIKDIYTLKNGTAVQELKEKLNGLIEHREWEVLDVIEHDYFIAPVFDCIVYYITGYLCKKIERHSKCPECRSAVLSSTQATMTSLSALCGAHERIIHPNLNFYRFLKAIEIKFMENINLPDVYVATVNDILAAKNLNFPCLDHKEEIMAWIINYYLCMRMRMWARQKNSQMEKQNCADKKRARFLKT